MSVRGFAAGLRAEIEALKEGGAQVIEVDNLLNYLRGIEASPEPEPPEATLERYKAELAQGVEAYKYTTAATLEEFRSIIQMGQTATRFMVLINGGAAIAILALLGNLARLDGNAVQNYASCLLPFVAGTLGGALVAGFTYLSQACFASKKPWVQKLGYAFQATCIALGIAAFSAFGVGSWWTYEAFRYIPIDGTITSAAMALR
ncbi:hypothetical protein ACLNGM_15000 [Aureimonas phyllosphaerae]|uniref:hypothetical protein n=1 Tax=Aureimonas phyllosphaerae TaxID=1166078 RepID=UPI003A5BE18C